MIEHESHSHAHHTGLPWVDLILAGSAIFISVISLIVSIHHGRTMEKLVQANEKQVKASTLPVLRFTTGNMADDNRTRVVHLDMTNGGTGPAMIDWLRVRWNGQPTEGPGGFLAQCCKGDVKSMPVFWNSVSGMTLPAGQSVSVMSVRANDVGEAFFRVLNDERFKADAEACYCSVLKECWVTDFKSQPRDVQECEKVGEKEKW